MRFPNGVELWLPQGDVALLTAAAPRRWSAKSAREATAVCKESQPAAPHSPPLPSGKPPDKVRRPARPSGAAAPSQRHLTPLAASVQAAAAEKRRFRAMLPVSS
jgi:hypothetical protein